MDAAAEADPAYHHRVNEVAGVAARLPQAHVGLAPAGLEPVEQSALPRPGLWVGRDALGARLVEGVHHLRSEEHTSELQSLMRISYAVFCLKKKKIKIHKTIY